MVDDSVERHIVPRRRRLLPEDRGIGAHLAPPVGGIVEAFARPEDFADMRAGKSRQLRIGDRGDNPVARLAPGEGRGGDEGGSEGRQGWQAHEIDTVDFGMASHAPPSRLRTRA